MLNIADMTTCGNYSGVFARMRQFADMGCESDHRKWLERFSGGKFVSLKQLGPGYVQAFERYLDNPVDTNNYEHNRLRRAIIAKLTSCGWSPADARQWAEKHGAHKEKKSFNGYNHQELTLLLGVVKKMEQQYKQKNGRD